MPRFLAALLGGLLLVSLTLPVQAISFYRSNSLLLETLDAETTGNEHPVGFVDPDSLAQLLASLQVESDEAGAAVYLMTENRAIKAAEELAIALGRVEPQQDVLLATYRDVGGFGSVRRLATAARVFAEGGQLNLIFGQVDTFIDEFRDPYLKVPKAGSRKTPGLTGGSIVPADWFAFKPGRRDWILFPISLAASPRRTLRIESAAPEPAPAMSTPAASAPPGAVVVPAASPPPPARQAPPPAKPAPNRWTDLEEGLETLERLKKKGLITDAEYQAKRKALLDSVEP